jgi:DNA invertase Pin-like site-specific DNA recombinase
VCVSQPELDTTTPIGRLLLTVLAAVAEFERELIRERVREGMANARRKGSAIGRPAALIKHPRLRWPRAELRRRNQIQSQPCRE